MSSRTPEEVRQQILQLALDESEFSPSALAVCFTDQASYLTPADVYFGRGKTTLLERERTKRQTIQQRRLQHQIAAA